jgi:hypothetical protein
MDLTRSPPLIHVEHVTLTVTFHIHLERKRRMEYEKPTDASEEELQFQSYQVHPAGVYRCRLKAIQNFTGSPEYPPSLKFV